MAEPDRINSDGRNDGNGQARRNGKRKFVRCAKYWYLRVVRQHASAHTTARGVCLGFVIGALPIIPFQTVAAIVLAFFFKTNKLVTWLATSYSNVFTLVPFYWFLYRVGKFVLPVEHVRFDPKHLEMAELIHTGWDLFLVMMVGGVIVGAVGGAALYFLTLKAVHQFRRIRSERREKRRIRRENASNSR